MQTKTSEITLSNKLNEQEIKELLANVSPSTLLICDEDLDLQSVKIGFDLLTNLHEKNLGQPTQTLINYRDVRLKKFINEVLTAVMSEHKMLTTTFIPGRDLSDQEKKSLHVLNLSIREFTASLASRLLNDRKKSRQVQIVETENVPPATKKRKVNHIDLTTEAPESFVKQLVAENSQLKKTCENASIYIAQLEEKNKELENRLKGQQKQIDNLVNIPKKWTKGSDVRTFFTPMTVPYVEGRQPIEQSIPDDAPSVSPPNWTPTFQMTLSNSGAQEQEFHIEERQFPIKQSPL